MVSAAIAAEETSSAAPNRRLSILEIFINGSFKFFAATPFDIRDTSPANLSHSSGYVIRRWEGGGVTCTGAILRGKSESVEAGILMFGVGEFEGRDGCGNSLSS